MATKSAGIPSEVASSASPRNLRTLGTLAVSGSSRQSRIASAISVGVISSSPAPSTTALTTAIAFRIRSAADRPCIGLDSLLGGGLARTDDHAPIGLLADARARHVRIALEGEMDGPTLERLHCIQRDRISCHLHLTRCAQCNLAHRVLAALAVALHVHDDALALGQVLAHHHVRHRLQSTQRLAAPSDQRAEVAARNVQREAVASGPAPPLGAP